MYRFLLLSKNAFTSLKENHFLPVSINVPAEDLKSVYLLWRYFNSFLFHFYTETKENINNKKYWEEKISFLQLKKVLLFKSKKKLKFFLLLPKLYLHETKKKNVKSYLKRCFQNRISNITLYWTRCVLPYISILFFFILFCSTDKVYIIVARVPSRQFFFFLKSFNLQSERFCAEFCFGNEPNEFLVFERQHFCNATKRENLVAVSFTIITITFFIFGWKRDVNVWIYRWKV